VEPPLLIFPVGATCLHRLLLLLEPACNNLDVHGKLGRKHLLPNLLSILHFPSAPTIKFVTYHDWYVPGRPKKPSTSTRSNWGSSIPVPSKEPLVLGRRWMDTLLIQVRTKNIVLLWPDQDKTDSHWREGVLCLVHQTLERLLNWHPKWLQKWLLQTGVTPMLLRVRFWILTENQEVLEIIKRLLPGTRYYYYLLLH